MFEWGFIACGIYGIAAAHFDWPHSRLFAILDPWGMHEFLDKRWVAGGRNRYYRTIGWTFLGLGIFMLAWRHFHPE